MDIEMIREFCLGLPGTTEGMKWGENLCFMIHEKIYALASLDDGTITLKCDPEDFDALSAQDGVTQASHFARKQWVTLAAYDIVPTTEMKHLITKSRSLVIDKLPKKLQSQLKDQD